VLDLPAQLRLALALAHAWPGGSIQLRTLDGSVLRAAHGGAGDADLTPCELRAALLSRACPLWPGVAARLSDIVIDGDGVADLGAGVYGRRGCGGTTQRWFATLLAPSTVQRLLDECPLELPQLLDASLRPDVELGVVVTVLSTESADLVHALDDASRWATASCSTQELLYSVQQPSGTP
jgi:hypothetical protein